MTVCYQEYFISITTLHVSGGLSAHHQEILAVHQLRYILCSFDDRMLPGVFYYYYDSTGFGRPFCPSSGDLSRTSASVHFMQF